MNRHREATGKRWPLRVIGNRDMLPLPTEDDNTPGLIKLAQMPW